MILYHIPQFLSHHQEAQHQLLTVTYKKLTLSFVRSRMLYLTYGYNSHKNKFFDKSKLLI